VCGDVTSGFCWSRYAAHAGSKLTPPVGDEARVRELGPLLPTDVRVRGDSFRVSSTDVAIAGLGWIGVAVDGPTDLRHALLHALPGTATRWGSVKGVDSKNDHRDAPAAGY